MRRLFLLLALALAAEAGMIQGVVLEHASGRPLARAMVRLQPAPQAGGGEGKVLTMRSGRTGAFAFSYISPGMYILMAGNEGYFPAAYGQRLPIGRGTPIQVTASSELFAELRMRHQGAITGRVLDENGVGKAGVSVVAYRARLPLRSAGRAVSDDRGIYRVHGLEPGRYWVRSAAHILEDGSGWLPTFGPRAREVRDAQRFTATVDTDTPDADISPDPGVLFHLSGLIGCDVLSQVNVTLSSETGRRSQQSKCGNMYRFDGLAPGVYEVFATTPDGMSAAYLEIPLERDHDAASLQLMQVPRVSFDVRRVGTNARVDAPISLVGRRQDPSDAAPPEELKSGFLAPGHWELRARLPAGQYVESITSTGGHSSRLSTPFRLPDWFEVFIPVGRASTIRIMVSDQAGQIQGRVMQEGKPVSAAPVFLWPVGEANRRSLGGDREIRADTEGNFRFETLPPGDYRLLASFDVNGLDEDLMLMSGARTISVEKSATVRIELPVWIAP